MKKKKIWAIITVIVTIIGVIGYSSIFWEELGLIKDTDVHFIEDDYKLYEQMLIDREYTQIDCQPFKNIQLNGVANIFFIKSDHSKIYYKKEKCKIKHKVENQTLYLNFKEDDTYGSVFIYTPFPIDTFKTINQEYISGMIHMLGFENESCHFIAINAGIWLYECDLSKIKVTLSNGNLEASRVASAPENMDIAIDMSDNSWFRFQNDESTNLSLIIKSCESNFDIEVNDCRYIRKIDMQGTFNDKSQLVIKSKQPQLNCDTFILHTESSKQAPGLSLPYQTTFFIKTICL